MHGTPPPGRTSCSCHYYTVEHFCLKNIYKHFLTYSNQRMPNTTLLQLMGLPPDEDDISYDICLDLSNASWDEVSSRITSHPSEAIEEDCLHGNSPLEILLKNKTNKEIPLTVYRKMLMEERDDHEISEGIFMCIVRKNYSDQYMSDLVNLFLDFVKNADGRRLVEMSIWYGNVAAAKVFIERFPDSLKKKDKIKGQLPLHIACEESNETCQSELIELLLKEGVKHKVDGIYGAGGLFDKDYKGTTPLMHVIHAMNNPFTWDATQLTICVKAAFESAMSLSNNISISAKNLDAADGENTNTSSGDEKWEMEVEESDHYFHFPILHEAMGISSPDAFYRIIEIVKEFDEELSGKDRRGRTALMKAIYLDDEEGQRRTQYKRKTSTKELISMIIGAVTSDCAKVRDGAGRLPLHIATEMGLKWDEGVRDLVFAYSKALEERHCVTGHYPFMTAAAGPDSELDTIFELMRAKPTSVFTKPQLQPVQELSFHFAPMRKPPVHWPNVHSGRSAEVNHETGTDTTEHSEVLQE